MSNEGYGTVFTHCSLLIAHCSSRARELAQLALPLAGALDHGGDLVERERLRQHLVDAAVGRVGDVERRIAASDVDWPRSWADALDDALLDRVVALLGR